MKKEAAAPIPDKTVLEARVIPIDDFARFLSYMPNPDEVLRDNAETISVYREMKLDPRIKSLLAVAKAAVLNFPVSIEQGSSSNAVYKFIQEALQSLALADVERRLMSAKDFGFAVLEILWKANDGFWIPDRCIRRRPERFRFTAEGTAKYVRMGETKTLDEAYKWLIYSHDEDAENPYGTSVLKACYWSWKIKKAGLEFWLMATEKFAVPSILALFEASGNEDDMRMRAQNLSEALASIRSGSGAALANIKEVQVVTNEGSLAEFKTLTDYCDTQIAYALVYNSLAVQEAENGTRAQAEVHEDVSLSTAKLECRDLQPVLQQYVDWIVALNYGPDEEAPIVVFDLSDYASWDVMRGAIEVGVPVSREALYSRYHLPKPKKDDDRFVRPEQPNASPLPSLPMNGDSSKVPEVNSIPATDVQSTALNGAQVASLVDLANQVSEGALPADSARAIAKAAFPLVKDEDLNAIFDPLKGFKPTTQTLGDDDPKKKLRSTVRYQRQEN